jgi:ribosome-associated protein
VTGETDPFSAAEFPGGGEAIAPGVMVAAGGMRIAFSRGSGPGGQNVNKVNTRAEIWVALGKIAGLSHAGLERLRGLAGRRVNLADELHLVSDVHRTQEGNRREVMQRLRELIVEAARQPKRRMKTRPTAASRRRRIEGKKRRSEIKKGRTGQGLD